MSWLEWTISMLGFGKTASVVLQKRYQGIFRFLRDANQTSRNLDIFSMPLFTKRSTCENEVCRYILMVLTCSRVHENGLVWKRLIIHSRTSNRIFQKIHFHDNMTYCTLHIDDIFQKCNFFIPTSAKQFPSSKNVQYDYTQYIYLYFALKNCNDKETRSILLIVCTR